METTLSSGVSTSPADEMLRQAIQTALRAAPEVRAELFTGLLREIEEFIKQRPEERPWTYSMFTGTDGSRIFRSGVGRAIVIDPSGVLWRGRNYEDFETEYDLSDTQCLITSLKPLYEQMQRYQLE